MTGNNIQEKSSTEKQDINPYKNCSREKLEILFENQARFILEIESIAKQQLENKPLSRNDLLLVEFYAMRNALLFSENTLSLIKQTSFERAPQDRPNLNEFDSLLIRKQFAQKIINTNIGDYRFQFPKEAPNKLRKFAAIGGILGTAIAVTRTFCPNDLTTQGIAAGSSILLAIAVSKNDGVEPVTKKTIENQANRPMGKELSKNSIAYKLCL